MSLITFTSISVLKMLGKVSAVVIRYDWRLGKFVKLVDGDERGDGVAVD